MMKLRFALSALLSGLLAALSFFAVAPPAWATSPPCQCHPESETITKPPGLSCVNVVVFSGCDESHLKNDCSFPIDLVDWPIVDATVPSQSATTAHTVLQPGEEVRFVMSRGTVTEPISRDLVIAAGGNQQMLNITFDRVCSGGNGDQGGGCSLGRASVDPPTAPIFVAAAALIGMGVRLRRRETKPRSG